MISYISVKKNIFFCLWRHYLSVWFHSLHLVLDQSVVFVLCFTAFSRCSSLKHPTAALNSSPFKAASCFLLLESLAPSATCQNLGLPGQHLGSILAAYQGILCSGNPFIAGNCWTLLQQFPQIFELVFLRTSVVQEQTWMFVDCGVVLHILYRALWEVRLFGHRNSLRVLRCLQ